MRSSARTTTTALARHLNAVFPTSSFPACTRCRAPKPHTPRLFSLTASSRSPSNFVSPPPPPSSGYAALPSRRLISIAGPDAPKFLQGVITASITGPEAEPRKSGFYTAFLTAQGRILFDVFIYPDTLGIFHANNPSDPSAEPGTAFLIEVDAAQASSLTRHIRRYKLRARLNARLLDDAEATVWHAWNDPAGGAALPPLDALAASAPADSALALDTRAPGMGVRFVHRGVEAPPLLDLDESTEAAYTVRRYLFGVPEGQHELVREQALPQESNVDVMGGVDYRKGCYVGQELTIRTKHRGVVRKRVLPCVLYGSEDPVPPTELAYRSEGAGAASVRAEDVPGEAKIESVDKRARNPGKWLRGVGNIGLALCRLETMTDVAGPLPTSSYKSTDEFKIEWEAGEDEAGEKTDGGSVMVKAFVPNWLRAALDAQAAQAQGKSQSQPQTEATE
ncbi:Aminomethyltransferase folate-binding domain-containing protein [Sodiomyces alkalinus F11]|uniref:Iron-sulfur cluster assembly factor IBA57 homolog, mitochondrial n=1 Tax=Sodiomyces alkalinus (strain CBS 110278 / VKM F-3762 / F11) TaxID=1314773 RepID=A0A3N2PNN4_SODAK|nr:Aminomethyltransferase folate-binding domain-containing protein [Sodiomyces alkalinus F11]ROT36044.1 Aminomethyltransferase folate-binding domain-containing protein [Sodiomyces alkalinus F11]